MANSAHLPTPEPKRATRWSIGRKLILLVAVAVTAGLAALVALQFWNQRGDLMQADRLYDGIINHQLSDAVSGGVKWGKTDVVEKAYAELLGDAAAGLATIAVVTADGALMTGADAADRAPYDLGGILSVASAALDAGGHYAAFAADHLVMAYPIKSGDERVGTLAVAWSTEALHAQVRRVLLSGVVVGFGVLVVLVGLLTVVLSRSVSRPLGMMTAAMQKLAAGDHGTEVPARARGDEIGDMARAVQVFKDNAIEMQRLKAQQEAQERDMAADRRKAMLDLAAQFEASVGSVVDSVAAASAELQTTAGGMTHTADESNRQAATVAAASEEASANVHTVAAATEELSASVNEISSQVARSAQIASGAVTEAETTNAQVQSLAEAAHKIGEVVNLITEIASQTNLLALNATIEAARAGEAGKGFAVVASEVKNLATQTAQATEDISAQIGAIQAATQSSVAAIGGIGNTIRQIDEIATAIAGAVEEQGAATREIASNVQQAAQGTAEVSSNIVGVTEAASQTGAAANHVLTAAESLSGLSARLRDEVGRFLQHVRAA
jgi:methyl-accepting chemotaxis protein